MTWTQWAYNFQGWDFQKCINSKEVKRDESFTPAYAIGDSFCQVFLSFN